MSGNSVRHAVMCVISLAFALAQSSAVHAQGTDPEPREEDIPEPPSGEQEAPGEPEETSAPTAQEAQPDERTRLAAAVAAERERAEAAERASVEAAERAEVAQAFADFAERQADAIQAIAGQRVAVLRRMLPALAPEVIAAIPPAQLHAALNQETISRLSDAQVAAISDDQRRALTDAERRQLRVVRRHAALRPGLRLIGDAYAQLVTQGGDVDADAAFGGGVDIEQREWRLLASIRKGTQPDSLDGARERGLSLINPQASSFNAGLEFEFTPQCAALPDAFMIGVRTEWYVAYQHWRIEPLPGSLIETPATTFSGTLGVNLLYVVADPPNNYASVSLYVGGSFRAVALDPGGTQAVQRLEGNESSTFERLALGAPQTAWAGLDIVLNLRINMVDLRAALVLIPEDGHAISGLTGWTFIPSVSVRTGAMLMDFAED